MISFIQQMGPRFALAVAVFSFVVGCSTINSSLQIESGNQFVLGGGSRGAFVVDARNVGLVTVTISRRAVSGQDIPVGLLAPGATARLEFPAGTAAVLENISPVTAKLSLKIRGDTALGMRYEPKP